MESQQTHAPWHQLRLLLTASAFFVLATCPPSALPSAFAQEQLNPLSAAPVQGESDAPAAGAGSSNAGDGTVATAIRAPPAQLRLGFMLPFPVGDSAIPPRVADEWMSAAKLALSVLAPKYAAFFTTQYYVTNSNCSAASAAYAAEELVEDGVHGVVGPACSESVVGADASLRTRGVPYISFAATADVFSSARYPTFFRTAFADVYQAQAIVAVAKQYHLTSFYLFFTNETYGKGLNASLHAAFQEAQSGVGLVPILVPYPPPGTLEEYAALFSPAGTSIESEGPSLGVILATPPNVAQGLLQAAMNVSKIEYPWWYLGTDGTVTFDLVGEGQNMAPLASAIQGEIGVGPYDGVGEDDTPEAGFVDFYNYWKQQQYVNYPGLLTLPIDPPLKRPRAYVVNLIDAITAFHEAARILLQSGHTLTRDTLLSCLKGMAPCHDTPVAFAGASGWVAFNSTSGDRLPLLTGGGGPQPEQYKVQNLVGLVWQYKGTWKVGDATGLSGARVFEVTRPGPIPAGVPVLANITSAQPYTAPDDLLAYATTEDTTLNPYAYPTNSGGSYSGGTTTTSGGMSTGTLVAIIILSVLLVLATIGAVIFFIRSRKRAADHAFSRMI